MERLAGLLDMKSLMVRLKKKSLNDGRKCFDGNKIRFFLGFDNSGRQLDLNGNLVNWWQKDTLNEFNKRAQCFVNKVK